MTTKEVYHKLICKTDLHSLPELHDSVLIWKLYKNAYIQAFCHNGDAVIDIVGDSLFTGSFMCWHPEEYTMVDELYALGKKGNLLVLKKSLLDTSIFYQGPSNEYALSENRSLYLGSKRWDGGSLIYLEQK